MRVSEIAGAATAAWVAAVSVLGLRRLSALLALALPWAASSGCSSSIVEPSGVCAVDISIDCNVSYAIAGGTKTSVGLVGYSCTGLTRPDENARYIDGVPEGPVCASRGATATGKQAYCCSSDVATPCAYDPVADCDSGDGYQCRGASRPEALNAAIKCGNGVEQGEYINYCCSGQAPPAECVQVNTVGCSDRLTGFSCPAGALPKGEQLGQSESRADYYRPLCPMPTIAANVTRNNYCCYMPALIPEGASCVQDTQVPGCAAGRFGFACYGPETPQQDYAPMHCPDKGVAGKSAEGYPATLYCCDFQ